MGSTGQNLGMGRTAGLAAVLAAVLGTGCGSSDEQQPLGEDFVSSIDAVASAGVFQTPLDAAPNPDASIIYFTASGSKGPGLFRVRVAGGAVEEIATGPPFAAPVGVVTGSDGQRVYVADPQAAQASGRPGTVFVAAAGGGGLTALRGTEGTAPRGMDVVVENGQETIYFTGKDPADGQPAVFKMPASGANGPSIVAKGAPLVEPDAVTVTKAGVLYVTDPAAGGSGMGSVFEISGTRVRRIVERLRLGSPAGVALTSDDAVLLVSAEQPDRDSAQVFLVDLGTLETGSVTKVVGQIPGAGGLHRARAAGATGGREFFAWCGSPMGPVFQILAAGGE